VQHLVGNPRAGREGHVAGTREWLISDTPYLVVYRTRDDEVEILRLWHGRKNRRNM
jgi:plasmid stabilization system protein ParE